MEGPRSVAANFDLLHPLVNALNLFVCSAPTGVKDFVKENFVFLQFGAQSPEGRKYASFYPFTSYPHIAIIDPRTGERVKQWNTCPTPADFIQEGQLQAKGPCLPISNQLSGTAIISAMEFLEFNSLDDNAKAPSRKRKIKVCFLAQKLCPWTTLLTHFLSFSQTSQNVSEMSEEEQILAAMEASLAASGGSSKAGSSNKTPVVNLDDDEEAVVVDEDEDVMGESQFCWRNFIEREALTSLHECRSSCRDESVQEHQAGVPPRSPSNKRRNSGADPLGR